MKRLPDSRNTAPARTAGTGGAFDLETLEPRVLMASTNDPLFSSQYALGNSNVSSAWDITRGSRSVVVADIDTGADYSHRDLCTNVWINPAEIPVDVRRGLRDVDRDGRISFFDLNNSANRPLMTDVNRNGYIDGGDLLSPRSAGGWEDGINGRNNSNDVYIDDIIGWDFAEGDNDPYDDGTVNAGHGTHTAGIIGAVGNNGVGISGVAQNVSMMIVRIFGDGGATTAGRIAAAIRYTADSGARAANASWGGTSGFNGDPIYSAIAYAGTKGEAFVTAAGNNGWNVDSSALNSYPAEYNLANIIVVGSTTSVGGMALFSNYGATTVDVMAPGASVVSTLPGNRYGQLSGTSMAAPMVTGAVALALSANRSLTVAQIKSRLVAGADESVALNNRSVSDGQLNVSTVLLNRAGTRISMTLASGNESGAGSLAFGLASLFSRRRIRG
jgi:subtilisin family serine protease